VFVKSLGDLLLSPLRATIGQGKLWLDVDFGRLRFDVLAAQLHKSAMESILISEEVVDDTGNWHIFELLSGECERLVYAESEGHVIVSRLFLRLQRWLYLSASDESIRVDEGEADCLSADSFALESCH
jgi:hypothetical protein